MIHVWRLTATTMRIARRIVFHTCCATSIALILLAFPTLARQSQSANSTFSNASVTGRITAVSGEGATNILPGVTVKLTGPSAGLAPQTTVTDAERHYECRELNLGGYRSYKSR